MIWLALVVAAFGSRLYRLGYGDVGSISAVAAGGLTLDIAGALLLALGLMFKKSAQAVEEASPKWSFNVDLEVALATQTADAQVGALLLVAGFGGQLAASFGARESTWSDVGLAMGAAGVIDVAAALFLFKSWRPFHLRRMLVARLHGLADMGSWWPALANYGPYLGKPAPPDIQIEVTYAEYAESLLGRKRWEAVVAQRPLPGLMTKLRRELPGTAEYSAVHGP